MVLLMLDVIHYSYLQEVTMLSTVTTKGQVTIPVDIRSIFHIQPNDRVDFMIEGDRIILTPVKGLKDLRGAVKVGGMGDSASERAIAKAAVAKRVMVEMA
jgi:AbrB family looped-hinge helix DNA binding protein